MTNREMIRRLETAKAHVYAVIEAGPEQGFADLEEAGELLWHAILSLEPRKDAPCDAG